MTATKAYDPAYPTSSEREAEIVRRMYAPLPSARLERVVGNSHATPFARRLAREELARR